MKISIGYLVIVLAAILSPAIAIGQNGFLANWSGSDSHKLTWESDTAFDSAVNLIKVDFSCDIFELKSDGIHSTIKSGLVSSGPVLDTADSLFFVDWSGSSIYEFASDGMRSTFISWLVPSDLLLDIDGNLFKEDFICSSYEFALDGTRIAFTPG